MKKEIAVTFLLIGAGLIVWTGSSRLDPDTQQQSYLHKTTQLPLSINSPGNQFVSESAKLLASQGPTQAKLRAEINLFDQQLNATGIYIQAGRNSPKTRCEIRFGNGEDSKYFIQIHDGRFLHSMYRNEFSNGEVTGSYRYADLEQVDWRYVKSNGLVSGGFGWFFTGSLAGMLDHCASEMQFSTPSEVTLDSMTATQVTGQWRPQSLQRLLEGQVHIEDDHVNWKNLPRHFPHGVKLTFSKPKEASSRFLHRIEFFQFDDESESDGTNNISTFELFEVGHLKELPEHTFKISSGEIEPTEETKLYFDRIWQFTR